MNLIKCINQPLTHERKVHLDKWMLALATIFWLNFGLAQGQTELTLDSCLRLAEQNYPLIKQYDLLEKATEYTVANVQKGKLPRFNIAGQASYQSAVTSLPGGSGPVISKDQYRLYGELMQPLTDLVTIEKKRQITEIQGDLERQDLSVQLYKVQEQVSEIYFSVLLFQKQLQQMAMTVDQILSGLHIIEAGVSHGTVLQSNADILKAEMLGIEQKAIEVEAARDGFLLMLSRFIGQEINTATLLTEPVINTLSNDIMRPELELFKTQVRSFQLQSELLNAENLPKFSLFFQGGVGRPALNFLSNDFELYYIGGLRLSWNVSNFYTSSKQKDVLLLNENMVENRKETFLFNTLMNLDNRSVQIKKAEQLIDKDQEIIALRESIRETAKEQLENGVITANDYNDAVVNEALARENLSLHQIELLKTKKLYQLTTGNIN